MTEPHPRTLEETPIAELTLAMQPTGETKQAEPGLNLIVPVLAVNRELRSYALQFLEDAGVRTAGALIELGCTGLAGRGLEAPTIQVVRRALEGSGVGLPCFIDTHHYCYAHSGIGGLQDGQVAKHTEYAKRIQRDLVTHERAHVEMIESARRLEGTKRAADVLTGRRVGDDFLKEVTAGLETGAAVPNEPDPDDFLGRPGHPRPPLLPVAAPPVQVLSAEDMFKCPEHGKTYWNCRYCVAAEIVKGPFEPAYAIAVLREGTLQHGGVVEAAAVDVTVSDHDAAGTARVDLYVRVAQWSRKLARD